ncbi:uncharacterized protein LOC124136129 [Haliotis rufescens]|uniref:uncharacterized protein LOC124136129 n=1 Tax=Haliotis rufescens TaxID=6454 RepID=UPI001EAFEFCB|nr:uncharacterized protein LOC124136129 [Haliotis rufescens]
MHHTGDAVKPTAELSSFGNSYMSPNTPGSGLSCVWGDHNQRLREILEDNRLPQIVKICEEDVVQSNGEGSEGFNFQQPLLLYKEVKLTRVFSRNVRRDPGPRGREREVGPYVVIPEHYPGFFKVLNTEGSDDMALTSLSTVARIMPASFLCLVKLKGFVAHHQRKDTLVYEKKEIPPGLLYVMNIHEDQVTYINSRKSEKRKLILSLRCTNRDRNVEILLPYDSTGQFYIVDLKKSSSRSCVNAGAFAHTISSIMQTFDKDSVTKVQLIYGDPPSQECQFTGVLRISHVTKEHTVIACTLNSVEPKILELSITPHPKFKLALQTADQHSDVVKRKCLAFMKTAYEKFRRDLKVRRDYEIEKRDLREDYD